MAKTFTPEEIEAYYFGRLSDGEKKEFELQLENDKSLQAELDSYSKILDGFMAKKTENFFQQMKSWENNNEFKDQDEIALIECYLNDELHPTNKAKLETQLTSDPAFAKKVAQQQQLMDGFEAKKSQAFAEKLKTWEDNSAVVPMKPKKTKVVSLFQRVAIAASFVLLLGLGTNWYANANFSNAALAGKFYQKPLSDATLGGNAGNKSQWLSNYESAHQKMNDGNFWNARQNFERLQAELYDLQLDEYNEKLYEDNIDWNIALAWLGVNDIQKASNQLETISKNNDHSYQEKAKELLQEFDSFWYNLAN
jgi:anti-sigma factor RsiW